MIPQKFAKSSELGFTSVFQAKLKRLQGGALIHNLETGVVAEDIENGAICLPQEFQPRSDNGSVSAVPGLFSGNCRQHNRFRGLGGLKVVNRINRDLLSPFLGFSNLCLGEFDEPTKNQLACVNGSSLAFEESFKPR